MTDAPLILIHSGESAENDAVGAEREIVFPVDGLEPAPRGDRQIDDGDALARAEISDDLRQVRAGRVDVLAFESGPRRRLLIQ